MGSLRGMDSFALFLIVYARSMTVSFIMEDVTFRTQIERKIGTFLAPSGLSSAEIGGQIIPICFLIRYAEALLITLIKAAKNFGTLANL